MKVTISELKKFIISEAKKILNENYEIYHETLSSVLEEVEKYAKSQVYKIGEYFPLINHINYGQTAKTKLSLLRGDQEVNSLNIQIYRMDSGRYELNCYFSNTPKHDTIRY